MTADEVLDLIHDGESFDVEFKGEQRRPLNDSDIVEAVVCLANRPGDRAGTLLIGVEDDGSVTGARPRHEAGLTDPLRVQALISGRTRPSLSVHASLTSLKDGAVLVIEVSPTRQPIGTADGKYVRRAMGSDGKPTCLPFHFHEMQSLQSTRGVLDYSAAIVQEATWQDLDPLEFERFRRRIRESQDRGDRALQDLPDIELAKALGSVEANGEARTLRILGLLLFGREEAIRRHLPTHEVALQVLHGMEVKVNDFFRWPLIRLMEEVETRFRARNEESELMVGMMRVGVPDCPEPAFREALANALIHRDYTRMGTLHVQWHADRIEISNPGGFPDGVRLDNLLVATPHPRNPLLADAFKRAGIVERTGRGIDSIFYEQLRTGHASPSYSLSTRSDTVLVLPGGRADLMFARLVVEENLAGQSLTLDEILILNRLCLDRQLDVAGAASLIQKPDGKAIQTIEGLVDRGLIEPRGEKNGRLFHLSTETCRRLGEKAARVARHGSGSTHLQNVVMQFVADHGSITRRQVAEMCDLSPQQSTRLLLKMAEAGHLKGQGAGKASKYVRSDRKYVRD